MNEINNKNHFVIKNGKIILEDSILNEGYLEIENGKIKSIGKIPALNPPFTKEGYEGIIDAEDNYVSPGLIDIHTHGAFGYSTFSSSVDAILKLSESLLSVGVTSFLPTTISLPAEEIIKSITNILEAKSTLAKGARILGINIEGPYINKSKAGAQFPDFIRKIDFNEVEQIIKAGKGNIKIVTFAPELDCAIDLISYLKSHKVISSAGHTDADYEVMLNSFKNGVELVTHVFSGMKGIHHREPGAAGAALLYSDVFCEMISDGFHIHPDIIKLIIKCKGVDKIILITDSIAAAGLGDGEFVLGPYKIKVTNGKAMLVPGIFAGSTLTLNKAIKNVIKFSGISLTSAVKMATLNPATLLRCDNELGSIKIGKLADIVIFDEEFLPKMTFKDGKLVYKI